MMKRKKLGNENSMYKREKVNIINVLNLLKWKKIEKGINVDIYDNAIHNGR